MGKNYVENSLKRFLKRKVKITLGVVVAFMIMGTGVFATELSTKTITKPYGDGNYTVSGNEVTVTNENGNVFSGSIDKDTKLPKAIVEVKENQVLNLITNSSGVISNTEIKGNGTISLTNSNGSGLYTGTNIITANRVNIKGNTVGVSGYGNNTISAKEIVIETTGTGKTYGIQTQGDGTGKVILKDFNKLTINAGRYGIQNAGAINEENIIITGNKNSVIDIKGDSQGIRQRGSATTKISAGTLNVSGSTGIYVGTGDKDTNILDIDVNNLNVLGSSTAVSVSTGSFNAKVSDKVVFGNGKINENGEFEQGTGNAISVSSNGNFNLEKGSENTVIQVNGNISATGGKIDLQLTNEQSYVNGKITAANYSGKFNENASFGFSNGATWNNTGDSKVTNLNLNGGIVNNSSVDNDIKVETLSGTGGNFRMAAQIGEDGKATSGKVTIGNANDNTQLDVTYTNAGTVEGDGEQAKEYFKDLANNITVTNGKITGNAKLEEGFVSGGYEADITIDNTGNKVENVTSTGTNSMVEGIRDLATINLLTWRQEMNSLNKRMGELRNSTGEHGVWSRVYTGKIENGSKYDNDYQTYQVGYDKKYTVDNGVMFVGGLVSYTDGETDYALGHGENYSVGAGIYATWLNNDGQFADVVLKQSRLHNKFDVTSKDLDKSQSGDYNNWGTSLSGQYGKRFDLNDKFFLEPSVELTLGRVDDTTYTTSAGVDVHQDTMYSLVGNVGTSVGYKFSDKGNVYARAALVKEFQGDIDTEYEKDGALERTSEDLGDTWAEFGVGVNYRFVENMNVYIDVQKTGEATVDNKWQANLGFRYEF